MPSTSKIVAHPDTGQPVKEVTTVSFEDIERTNLENEVNDRQNRVNDLQAEVEAKQKELSDAQVALEDSKSNLGSYDQIAPQPANDQGSEGAGGENADANAEGAISVPVSTEQPQF